MSKGGGIDPAQLAQILSQLTVPDTEAIKAAEAALRVILKKPSCVAAIVTQLRSCPEVRVRQVAAVVLRKRIVKHWKSLKAGAQTQIKATLLESMMQEPEKVVRHAVAALAAALAKALVPKKAWPELFVFINQCAASAESAPHRELAYYLLHALAESIGTNLTAHLGARRAPRAARRAQPTPPLSPVGLCSARACARGTAHRLI